MFVLLFKNGNNDIREVSFEKYYMASTKIKDFNTLIDNKLVFDQPNKKHMKELSKCQKVMIIQQAIY